MEHHQKGIARKWQRHFRETKTTVAIALMIFGLCFLASFVCLWPQKFSADVFNSRLLYHTIIDIEDYFTCSPDYQKFVIYEPSQEEKLISIFMFNVTNAADTIQQGYKPHVVETGPYGYLKYTYKYDVSFDTSDSLNVTFKEYTLLKEATDPYACQRMFFKLDRNVGSSFTNLCYNGVCKCRDHSEELTTINALFLKFMWADTTHKLFSHFSQEVMEKVVNLMEYDFVNATKAHLVPIAYQEIFLFRQQMQISHFLNTSFSNLMKTYTIPEISTKMLSLNQYTTPCGLSKHGISTCPISIGDGLKILFLNAQRAGLNASTMSLPSSVADFIDPLNTYSFLNNDYGLPMWLAICWKLGYVTYNSGTSTYSGYTMISPHEISQGYTNFIEILAMKSYNITTPNNITDTQLIESKIIIDSIAYWLGNSYVKPYESITLELVFQEFGTVGTPVACAPLGEKCIWQWAYMRTHGMQHVLSRGMISSLIDIVTKVNTNPNNLYYDGNSPSFYNTFAFCERYHQSVDYKTSDEMCELTDLSHTYNDALLLHPAGLWGIDYGITSLNMTYVQFKYKQQSKAVRSEYFLHSCNISSLIFKYYREETDFHDIFVVKYLNKYKEVSLNHTFTVGKWEEIGWAQWGGGYVTNALLGVRSTYQIERNGMWVFGQKNYYNILLEYATWANKYGFPNAYISDVYEARDLMHTLSRNSITGNAFREHLSYRATTFIGDGENFINDIGNIGEVTYIEESIYANFSCTGDNTAACNSLNKVTVSSGANCDTLEALYTSCRLAGYGGNKWLTNCGLFRTALSDPLDGIKCDYLYVYGRQHPFDKLIGNIVFIMVLSMTVELRLMTGLWCLQHDGCRFDQGGMYVTSTVRQILFEGYSEPSVLYYLNAKHSLDDVHFLCRENPYDHCGQRTLRCNSKGLVLYLPYNRTLTLTYGLTPHDEFFAPEFKMLKSTGELLWPHSMNVKKVKHAMDILTDNNISHPSSEVLTIYNPHWTAYPAWNSHQTYDNIAFNKFIQCQRRLYSGLPNQFTSCFDTLDTGRAKYSNVYQILEYRGNDSIYFFPDNTSIVAMPVLGTAEKTQHQPYLWDGFSSYPYLFNFKTGGDSYITMSNPVLFDKVHALYMVLSQTELYYNYQRDILTSVPFLELFTGESVDSNHTLYYTGGMSSKKIAVAFRRFAEDVKTWNNVRKLGVPLDSYGMPYKVPIAMVGLQMHTSLPLFVGTAHDYGNELWGGLEFGHVKGYTPDQYQHRTFIDYDPVMGKAIRSALRHQIHLRIERNPLMPNLASSQQRCLSPAKTFSGSLGYGCYAYVPLFWMEDGYTMEVEQYFRNYDHYYTRPARALKLTMIGSIIAAITFLAGLCLYTSESFHRKKFKMRVYVD